jgi:hypothetical protein
MMDVADARPERDLHVPLPAASRAPSRPRSREEKAGAMRTGAPKHSRDKSREVWINPSDRTLDHSGYAACRPEGVKEVAEVSCHWGRR